MATGSGPVVSEGQEDEVEEEDGWEWAGGD